ncbi:hypothetical protein CCH79_00019905 [Gambusia affinis]|uniref:Pyrin domain-containing protein n=1 Tax=Gambusia affinis TaxID=33528 RepID=A0A315VJ14_GAMAF|nr:hypothetical protein CCH79_00019905 [Gambusia affinis]
MAGGSDGRRFCCVSGRVGFRFGARCAASSCFLHSDEFRLDMNSPLQAARKHTAHLCCLLIGSLDMNSPIRSPGNDQIRLKLTGNNLKVQRLQCCTCPPGGGLSSCTAEQDKQSTKHMWTGWANSQNPPGPAEGVELVQCSTTRTRTTLLFLNPRTKVPPEQVTKGHCHTWGLQIHRDPFTLCPHTNKTLTLLGAAMKKEDILNTLKKLGQKEFDEFKWFLEQPESLPELPAISKQHLEGANVLRVVDLMVQTYTLDRCREVFFTILKKINRNDLRLGLLKDWMRKTEAEVQEMIQERRLKIQEIRESVKISKDAADREKAEGVQVFTALIESVERGLKEILKEIQDKQETTEKQAEDFIRDLEQEISELKKRSSEVKQLSQDEDHLHLLQSFSSLKDAPPTETWTEVRVHPPSYEETVVKALALFEQNKEKILELKRIQQFAINERFSLMDLVLVGPNTSWIRPVRRRQRAALISGAIKTIRGLFVALVSII